MNRSLLVVRISDMKCTNDENAVLVTYSLGSCVGLTVYDPVVRVGGMIHCLLPTSAVNPERARQRPQMYVDTGVDLLIRTVCSLGANRTRLIVKAAGGGDFFRTSTLPKIGDKNYAALVEAVKKNRLRIDEADIGGAIPRTLYLDMAGGETVLQSSVRRTVL